jgi:8-oxo-dGTP pyrophosphatase MutT (NUDIX family)
MRVLLPLGVARWGRLQRSLLRIWHRKGPLCQDLCRVRRFPRSSGAGGATVRWVSDARDVVPEADYTATLPTKRTGAGVLFTEAAGRMLLVQPVYKDDGRSPAGADEAHESPFAAVCREVSEELGLSCTPGTPLTVDWIPATAWPYRRTHARLQRRSAGRRADHPNLGCRRGNCRGSHLCTLGEATRLLSPLLTARWRPCVRTRDAGTVAYLDSGLPRA